MARLFNILTLTVFYLWSFGDTVVKATSVILPPGTGPNDVGTIELELVDYSRTNPFAADTSNPGPRSFMVQLFYPAKNVHKYPLAPYMRPGTAAYHESNFGLPNGTISLIQTNSHSGAPIKSCNDIQTIIFSTGYGVSRQSYTTFAEDLASHGYLVITIDHPYDAGVVEFPDGSLVFNNLTKDLEDPGTRLEHIDIRVKDTQFTLDLLYSNLTKSIPGVRTRIRIQETGMFGHSLGGATAAETMFVDSRICGGIDLDGSLGGQVVNKGLAKPFLLMGAPSHNTTSDPTWGPFWEHLSGWKRSLVLADSQHLTYSDFPVVAQMLSGIIDLTPKDLEQLFGTIDGLRANVVLRTYLLAFFEFVLRGESDCLFEGPDPLYPEISYQS